MLVETLYKAYPHGGSIPPSSTKKYPANAGCFLVHGIEPQGVRCATKASAPSFAKDGAERRERNMALHIPPSSTNEKSSAKPDFFRYLIIGNRKRRGFGGNGSFTQDTFWRRG